MKKEKVKNSIFLALVVLANYWLWHFLNQKNYLCFSLMVIFSFVIFFLNYFNHKLKYFILLFPAIFLILSGKPDIFSLDGLEIHTINQRRNYYSQKILAKVFENKVSRYIFNYQKNFFEGLDPNYYFFGTHPRERVGIKEIKKFPFFFIFFFLLGIYYQLRKNNYFTITYFFFTLALASFYSPIDRFSFLFFPFFVLAIYDGLIHVFQKWLGKLSLLSF